MPLYGLYLVRGEKVAITIFLRVFFNSRGTRTKISNRSTESTTARGARKRTPERSVGARGERIELPSAESKNESL